MKYSRKKLCIINKIKCQQNIRKFNKITVEKVNQVLKKKFLTCKGCLYNILGELRRKLCKMFLFFSIKIITMEAKQEEHKIPTKCMQKVHKMFVNVHKQSTRLKKLKYFILIFFPSVDINKYLFHYYDKELNTYV